MASLFDTGVFWRLGRRERVAELLAIRFNPPLICLHVAAELIYGAKWASSSETRLLETRRLIASYEMLLPTPATVEIYTDLRVLARRAGKDMPDPDYWIAAHAIENRLPLVSMDNHFAIFDELNLHLLR